MDQTLTSPQKRGPVLPTWLSGVQLRTQNPPEEAPGAHNDLACYSALGLVWLPRPQNEEGTNQGGRGQAAWVGPPVSSLVTHS